MKIEHIAIWTQDLEKLREFYVTYFQATANGKYVNPSKKFESYFLTFKSGARLELMQRPDIFNHLPNRGTEFTGYAHLAFATGSKENVNKLTEQLRSDGYEIVGKPRTTGDGYYESVILDPDGNKIEITA